MTEINDPARIAQALDPRDVLDCGLDLSPLLAAGDAFDPASIVVTVNAASAALGVGLLTDAAHAPALAVDGATVVFWPAVDPAHVADDTFSGYGIEVDLAVDIATTHTPPRRFQRTATVEVRDR